MPSSKEYLEYVLDQLSLLGNVSSRAMMGEYIIYCNGKPVGGIYDDRLLIKPVPAAEKLMPNAARELPYEGAREMLLVENVDDRKALCALFAAVAEQLPQPKKRNK